MRTEPGKKGNGKIQRHLDDHGGYDYIINMILANPDLSIYATRHGFKVGGLYNAIHRYGISVKVVRSQYSILGCKEWATAYIPKRRKPFRTLSKSEMPSGQYYREQLTIARGNNGIPSNSDKHNFKQFNSAPKF